MLQRRALLFSLLYSGVIVYLSLYPAAFLPEPKAPMLVWHPLAGRRPQLDAVLNFLFYLPLGFSVGLSAGARRKGVLVAGLAGACLSYSMESLQLWTPSRDGNYVDWLVNSIGAIVGAALARASRGAWHTSTAARRYAVAWRLEPIAALFCGLWFLWFAFPFVPRIALSTTLQQFQVPAPWSGLDFARALLGFASLRVIVGQSPWIEICAAVVLSQAVLEDRTLSLASVAGTLLGWGFAARVPFVRRLVAVALPLWLMFEEFRPFVFSDVPTAFSWSPFESWFSNSASTYYPVVFQKLYLYTATPWLLRVGGWRWRYAAGVPLLILLVGEWLQRYVPGRTPELSDVVLCLAGLTLLLLLQEYNLRDA